MITGSGKQKKVITNQPKTLLAKKNPLQINTNLPVEHTPIAKMQSPSNKPQSISDHNDVQTKNINHQIAMQPFIRGQTPEFDNNLTNSKKLAKKNIQKDFFPLPKVENIQKTVSNTVTNGFTSPKGAVNREKIVFSFGSQKVLPNKPNQKQKKDQKDIKNVKIEDLQKIIQESKIKETQFISKQSDLQLTNENLEQENEDLKKKLSQLQKKVEKIVQSNNETKKMLKQRIHSFNEEGGELQALRTQIKTLQERIQKLLIQNQELKVQINKFSDYNLKQAIIPSQSEISNVRQVHLKASRVSQLYLKQSDDQSLLQFNNIDNAQDNLNLDSYISQAQESYLEEYKNNVDAFDKIKKEYEEILKDIDIRYKNLAKEYSQTILEQAKEIYDLQQKQDELYSQLYSDFRGQKDVQLNISMDQVLLKTKQQVATLNIKIHNIKQQNIQLIQKLQQHRAHSKFLQAQIDIQRMKKKFINQNDKFEYNVVKLNLLTIIDKLKMQIDKQKQRYKVIYNRLVTNRSGIIQNK